MGRGWQLLIGIACIAGSIYTAGRSLEFRRHGVVVEGTVVSVDSQLEVSGDGVSHSQRAVVRYTPASGGAALELTTIWGSALFRARREGDIVRIRHLPAAPADAREDSLFFDWAGPAALLLLGIGGLSGRLQREQRPWLVWRSGDD